VKAVSDRAAVTALLGRTVPPRTGKFAKLSPAHLEFANGLLKTGITNVQLAAFLNSMAEELWASGELRNGEIFSAGDVEEWRAGGFADWLKEEGLKWS
jgi:hypothetical protein